MTFKLPSEVPILLENLYHSPVIYPLVFFLLYPFWALYKNRSTIFSYKQDFVNVSTIQIATVIVIWFIFDRYFIHFNEPYLKKSFLFVRNLFSISIGIFCLNYYFENNNTDFSDLLGRFRPFHSLVAIGLVTGVLICSIGWLISIIYPFEVILQNPEPITIKFLLFVFLTVFLIPFTEELFFRYQLYSYLRSRVGIIAGIGLSSAIFAVAHGLSPGTISIFAEAVLLTVLVEYTQSIIPGLILHGAFNFLITCGGFWL